MLCHLLTKLELTASASMAQRLTDDCVCQWVKRDHTCTSLMKQQFVVTHAISQTEIPTFLDRLITNKPLKMLSAQKNCFPHIVL